MFKSKQIRSYLTPIILVSLSLIVVLIFKIYPTILAIQKSFFDWNGFSQPIFLGLRNFIDLLKNDKEFYQTLLNTTIFTVISTTGKISISLLLAVLLNEKIKGSIFFRTIIFIPVVMSMAATGLLWNFIYNPDIGILDSLLRILHLDFLIKNWLDDPRVALFSVSVVEIWKWSGFHMVIYLAGLGTIDPSLYEASMIDGAGVLSRFKNITLPLLKPYTFVNLLLCITGGFGVFDLIYVITKGGGMFHTTESILTYMYKVAFKNLKVGYADAIILILFLIVVLASALLFRFQREGKG
jgi:raffinose/stachyose/melibiose transport system permease protein